MTVTAIRENGAVSGPSTCSVQAPCVLATYTYDDLGRRTRVAYGSGTEQLYGYDPVSRLASLTNNLDATANNLGQSFAYNPASQIASQTRSNDAYAWASHVNRQTLETPNGLNQLVTQCVTGLTWDARGNVASIGTVAYGTNVNNQLIAMDGITQLYYEPLGRLIQQWNGGDILDHDVAGAARD